MAFNKGAPIPFIFFNALATSLLLILQELHKMSSLYIDKVIPQPPAHNLGLFFFFCLRATEYLATIFSFVAAFLQATLQYI